MLALATALHDSHSTQVDLDAVKFTLATTYYRSRQLTRAYHVLRSCRSPDCRYLLALTCVDLEKYHEAELALIGDEAGKKRRQLNQANPLLGLDDVPRGAAGFYLLGRICQRTHRYDHAVRFFEHSLELDSFNWSAFTALCEMGANVDVQNLFNISMPAAAASSSAAAAGGTSTTTPWLRRTPNSMASPVLGRYSPIEARFGPLLKTPTGGVGDSFTTTPGQFVTPTAEIALASSAVRTRSRGGGARRVDAPPFIRRRVGVGGSSLFDTSDVVDEGDEDAAIQRELREEAEAETPSFQTPAEGRARAPVPGPVGLPVSVRRRRPRTAATPDDADVSDMFFSPSALLYDTLQHEERAPSSEAVMSDPQWLSTLFRTLGEGYRLLYLYRCKEATEVFHRLPASQFQTGWVQCQLGRCFFETSDFTSAVRYYQRAREVEPHRLEGMDYYSTALWQLKMEVELAFLAQQARELSRMAPETWIITGNCFSLQKEHETALRFFRRALQIDPWCTYAYTLTAHEFVANEDYDKAITGYRQAIVVDQRHYTAWYGLGSIYNRQEKYDVAAYHFRRALEINPRSSVLHCYLGMVLHSSRRFTQALDRFEQAERLEPTNPLAKFHKAQVFVSLEEYDSALEELTQVREFAPREASVHFLMGKIYRRKKQFNDALLCFATALDLNPTDSNLVRAAMDRLHEEAALEADGDDDIVNVSLGDD